MRNVLTSLLLAVTLMTTVSFAQTRSGKILHAAPLTGSTATLTYDTSDGLMWSASSGITAPTCDNCLLHSSGGVVTTVAIGSGSGNGIRKPIGKAPTISDLTTSIRKVAYTQLAPSNYLRLAASIGLESAGTDEARLLSLLNGCDADIYDFDKVDSYLTYKAYEVSERTVWVWKPARKADMGNPADPLRYQQSDTIGIVDPVQYAGELPIRAMERMASILADMPDAVFLVSDYETKRPDPFLAVTTRRLLAAGKLWVIERWDEPGFDDQNGNGLRAAK